MALARSHSPMPNIRAGEESRVEDDGRFSWQAHRRWAFSSRSRPSPAGNATSSSSSIPDCRWSIKSREPRCGSPSTSAARGTGSSTHSSTTTGGMRTCTARSPRPYRPDRRSVHRTARHPEDRHSGREATLTEHAAAHATAPVVTTVRPARRGWRPIHRPTRVRRWAASHARPVSAAGSGRVTRRMHQPGHCRRDRSPPSRFESAPDTAMREEPSRSAQPTHDVGPGGPTVRRTQRPPHPVSRRAAARWVSHGSDLQSGLAPGPRRRVAPPARPPRRTAIIQSTTESSTGRRSQPARHGHILAATAQRPRQLTGQR